MRLSREDIFLKVASQEMSIGEATRYLAELDSRSAQPEAAAPPVQYPLSEAQKGLWVAYQHAPESYAYNLPIALLFEQELDVAAMRRAVQRLFEHHACLRATIAVENGQPLQRISSDQTVPFHRVVATGLPEADVQCRILQDSRQPFDLERGPLMRATLYSLSETRHILLLCFHHIIFDGISLAIFQKDLLEGYLGETGRKQPVLTEAVSAYGDFVQWQQQMLAGEEGARHREYWLRQMGGDLPVLELPLDKPRPLKPSHEGQVQFAEVNAALTERLSQLAMANKTTLFAVMLAAFQVMLHRYTGQEEVLVGTPVAGRPDERFTDLIGYFVNMIVIKSRFSDNPAFSTVLKQVTKEVWDGLEHCDYPYYTLMRELRKGKEIDSNLFQVSFSFQSWVKDMETVFGEVSETAEVMPKALRTIYQAVEYDLALEVMQMRDRCTVLFKYNGELFEAATIERMAGHYLEILQDVVVRPQQPVGQIKMLTDAEWHQLLVEWNDNDADFPRDKGVHQLFEEQAEKNPGAIAVVFEDQEMTYGDLNRRASQLAYYLNRQGIEAGDFVGVFIERSIAIPVVLLGILKAGAAYVPFDPIYPAERLSFMLEESQVPIVVSQSSLADKLPNYNGQVIRLDQQWELIEATYAEKDSHPVSPRKPTPDDVAYVLYTSGSTGKPKGVQVQHKGLTNVMWFKSHKRPGFTSRDRLLAIFTICFDMSVVDVFLPLINGGIVDIVPAAYLRDGQKLKEKVERGEATFLQATPATCQMLISAGWKKPVRAKLITGGDTLTRTLADKLLQVVDELYNGWGPTETSIYNSNGLVRPGEKITIGRPYDNNKFYVLDKYLNPVPIGVVGEAYLGGVQVSRGYLKRPELTEKAFLPDPFRREPGARMYKTGDLVRYLPDGRIDIRGRADRMVKLRGFRIELEEVEAALLKASDVKEAVALVREDDQGHKRLIAFLKRHQDVPLISQEERREDLKKRLPPYMVPTVYLFMEQFPLTVSLKVDKKQLLNSKISELVELYGDKEATPAKQSARPAATMPAPAPVPVPIVKKVPVQRAKPVLTNEALLQRIEHDLVDMIAAVTGSDALDIDGNTNLEEQGFDSVSITEFVVVLNEKYSLKLSAALFFECTTVSLLASYLLNNHYEQMRQTYAQAAADELAPETETDAASVMAELPACATVSLPLPNLTGAAPVSLRAEPIAIIGIGAKMPQSASLEEFWRHLEASADFVTEVPAERWNADRFYGDPIRDENKTNSKWGSFLNDVDRFDADFFGVSKREAQLMDPQQRLLLETVWQMFEHAGYKPSGLSGSKTGVYMGVSGTDYADVLRAKGYHVQAHYPTAIAHNLMANRISHLFNLRGPSMAVDTGASSMLVALHNAVTALQCGDCELALAGGVNLLLSPYPDLALSKLGLLSHDGKCKVFDKTANGYVRGEGIGAFLLKPLRRALQDGDTIHAVIRGSAVNHSGAANSLTVPDREALSELLVDVYRKAKVAPQSVGYVEVSGLATLLGDETEVSALKQAFAALQEELGSSVPDGPLCGLGSVKSNMGNLEAAAGAASMLKVILAMKHAKLPATLHVEVANPYLDLADSPFRIVQQPMAWERRYDQAGQPLPRRAGVSAFGLGGASAHVVLEEYSQPAAASKRTGAELVAILSAKTEAQLKELAQELVAYLEQRVEGRDYTLEDLAYTLQVGREALEERLAVTVTSGKDLQKKLTDFCQGKTNIPQLSRGRAGAAAAGMLLEGEEGAAFLRSLIQNRKTAKLTLLWVSGTEIDWNLLYDSPTPRRIPLPTYPFAGERHGLEENQQPLAANGSKITVLSVDSQEPSKEFRLSWKGLFTDPAKRIFNQLDVTREYVNLVQRHEAKLLRLLVETKTGSKMEVVISGKGKPLLLVNGFGLTAPSFYYQFRDWASEYQLINIHAPGIGLSEVTEDVTLQGIAKLFVETLDELGIEEPVHVVALCWGGLVGQTIAAEYPERVADLTLINSISQELLTDVEKTKANLLKEFEDLHAVEYYEVLESTDCLNPKAANYGDVITTIGYSTRDLLHKIQCPTLILIGTEDIVVDRNESKVMHSMISHSEYREMPGAGHALFMTHFTEFNEIVMDFLKRQERNSVLAGNGATEMGRSPAEETPEPEKRRRHILSRFF